MLTKIQMAVNETLELIDGPAGKLELAISKPPEPHRSALGIVCHPHPLYGGTMQNKVVTTLVKTLQGLGVTTVRFNFRGVGQSEGTYDDGNGELDDLLAVLSWMQLDNNQNEIWLAGFSFGAYIATKAAAILPVNRLITIAPPVNNFHMEIIPPISCPWLIVQGEKDDIVSAADVYAWAEDRDPMPTIVRFPTAGHFFHGLLSELKGEIEGWAT